MSARQNYGFERRRKDQMRRAKQEEKRQRKTDREAAGETGPEMGEAQEAAAPAGMWEWFSPSRGRTVSVGAGTRCSSASQGWQKPCSCLRSRAR